MSSLLSAQSLPNSTYLGLKATSLLFGQREHNLWLRVGETLLSQVFDMTLCVWCSNPRPTSWSARVSRLIFERRAKSSAASITAPAMLRVLLVGDDSPQLNDTMRR